MKDKELELRANLAIAGGNNDPLCALMFGSVSVLNTLDIFSIENGLIRA